MQLSPKQQSPSSANGNNNVFLLLLFLMLKLLTLSVNSNLNSLCRFIWIFSAFFFISTFFLQNTKLNSNQAKSLHKIKIIELYTKKKETRSLYRHLDIIKFTFTINKMNLQFISLVSICSH